MAGIKIKEEKILSKEHAVLKQLHFDIQKKDGDWERQVREVFDHGNAVTILLYNPDAKTILLTKQFRIATYVNGSKDGMLLETCAGLLEEGENPEEAVIREVEEETGYIISNVQKLFEAYSSPGAYSELVHYYAASYSPDQKQSDGGGLEEEGEEIRLVEMPFQQALSMISEGQIKDAKTILLLYYLQAKQLL
jgi:nudix-type nucleoside diphosphatase (YffH/AdpP family)